MTLPIVGRHATLDLAGPADNDDICRLFRDVRIKGELELNQERDPDFFALGRLHHGVPITFLAREPNGQAAAIASAVVRDAWLDGQRVRTAYLCDLRLRPGYRGGASLARSYSALLGSVRDAHDVQVFHTVVFDDNTLAKSVLMGPGAIKRKQPIYRPMTPFHMINVQFTGPCRAPRGPVRSATEADLPALKAFLDRRGRGRVLGEDFSGTRLHDRLRDWPGLGIGSFLLAHNASGELIGCVAPWDSRSCKRTRVLGYNGGMLWTKRLFNAGSTVLRYPPLPHAGGCFDFFFLTHLEVEGDDPAILRRLLRAAYRTLSPKRAHFMSALVPTNSPLEPAFRGFMTQRMAMTLYSVTLPDGPWADRSFTTSTPGFEMALS